MAELDTPHDKDVFFGQLYLPTPIPENYDKIYDISYKNISYKIVYKSYLIYFYCYLIDTFLRNCVTKSN